MIDKLKQIEDKLILELLSQPDKWQTLLVNYFPPMVERCWIQIGNYRLMLHWIHECKPEEALFHTHRWPSAMHILDGTYEMGLGFGAGTTPPEKMATILFDRGGYYDMTHIDGWHYVRPVKGVCATTMLIGKPWEREETVKDFPKMGPLSEQRKQVMLQWFANWYRTRVQTQRMQDNSAIQRGDWVELDKAILSENEKKGFEAFFDKKGFVIGVHGPLIDVRFGNDRTEIHTSKLKLLDPSTKPTSKPESEEFKNAKDWGGKKVDDMDPANWPDDDKDEI